MSMPQESSSPAVRGSAKWGTGDYLSNARTTAVRPSGLSRRALSCAIAYIEANLGERFTLYALAASAGVSRFHFARLFRISTGQSPMRYLTRTRIERGKHLLESSGASVCEIAAQLGFCDQSHFTRTFRRVTGMSPREYVRLRAIGGPCAVPTEALAR